MEEMLPSAQNYLEKQWYFNEMYDLHLALKLLLIYFYKLGIVNFWAHFKYTDY
jgi:hypothetical protein